MRKKMAETGATAFPWRYASFRRFVSVMVAGLVAAFMASPSFAETGGELVVSAARMAGDRVKSRAVFEFDRKFSFTTHYVTRPDRIVIDLPAARFSLDQQSLKTAGLFHAVHFGTMDADSARIVLTVSSPAKLVAADVARNENGQGYRLVLEAESVDEATYRDLVAKQNWATPVDDASAAAGALNALLDAVKPSTEEFIVAVDAGHGGIDAGASGAARIVGSQQGEVVAAEPLVAELSISWPAPAAPVRKRK